VSDDFILILENEVKFQRLKKTLIGNKMTQTASPLTWKEFEKVDMRVGTIVHAEVFEEARNPSYKITISFGEYGLRKTSAQITTLYTPEELIGRQVIAVINFPPKQIANMLSECLLLGAVDGKDVTLLSTERPVKNGLKIG
jgi:tRNA-binding protein